jgi:aminocarboxymuconate-semialdehyde decarboxylase
MRIDAHAHAQPPAYARALTSSGRYEVARGPDDQLIVREHGAHLLTISPQLEDPAERVAALDAAGIDVQILSLGAAQVDFLAGQPAIELARSCNDYLAVVVQRYPTRFRALASVPLTADVDAAIAELVRCLDELGMLGVVVGTTIDGRPLDDAAFDPFYEELNRRGTPLFIHPTAPAAIEALNAYALLPLLGFMFETTVAVARLIYANFFGRFLGINVLVAHLGGALPHLAGRLDAGYEHYAECQGINRPPSEIMERLYLDTAGFDEPTLRSAVALVGEEHLIFGSDFPDATSGPRDSAARIESIVARRHRGKVLGDNATRLFGLGT